MPTSFERINHLRRMADATLARYRRWYEVAQFERPEWWIHRRNGQYRRFSRECLAEATRLKGEF